MVIPFDLDMSWRLLEEGRTWEVVDIELGRHCERVAIDAAMRQGLVPFSSEGMMIAPGYLEGIRTRYGPPGRHSSLSSHRLLHSQSGSTPTDHVTCPLALHPSRPSILIMATS